MVKKLAPIDGLHTKRLLSKARRIIQLLNLARTFNLVTALALAGLIFINAFSPWIAKASATGDYLVSGVISDSQGQGVEDVKVTATLPGSSTVAFGPVASGPGGNYQIYVQSGTYDFHYQPAGNPGFGPVIENNVEIMGDQTINVSLADSSHVLSGRILDQDNNPISGLEIQIGSISNSDWGEGITDPEGNFNVVVSSGTYTVTAISFQNGPPAPYPYMQISSANQFDLTADITQDFVIHFVPLTVQVEDANGNPVEGAIVNGWSATGGQGSPIIDGSNEESLVSQVGPGQNAITGKDGTVTFLVPNGTDWGQQYGANAGSDNIYADLPTNQRLYMSAPLVVNGATTVTLKAPLTHNFAGTVYDQQNNPIPYLTVQISDGNHGASATTDGNGHFSMAAVPGSYHVSQMAFTGGPPNGLPYFDISSSDQFDLSSDIVQDLTVDLVPLTINVVDSSGQPVGGALIKTYSSSLGTGDPIVSGSSLASTVYGVAPGSNVYTDSDGKVTFLVPNGTKWGQQYGINTTNDNIVATLPDGEDLYMSAPLVVSGATSVTIHAPVTHSIAGKLTDQNNNPLAGAQITFVNSDGSHSGSQLVDSDGNFTVNLVPDIYHVSQINFPNGPPANSIFPYFNLSSEEKLDIIDSSINQDFHIRFEPLTVTVIDGLGNPVSDAIIGGNATSTNDGAPIVEGSTTPSYISQVIPNSPKTDSDGKVTFLVPNGTKWGQQYGINTTNDNIVATLPDGEDLYATSPLTITGPTDLLLAEKPIAPLSPVNLTATSPTNTAPILSWSAAIYDPSRPPAAGYNIYRNGGLIGHTANTSYTDSSVASDGSYSYYVTATAQNGAESDPSNSVSVIYDHTAPTITYSVTPTPNGAGWNNTNVEVTFTCDDNLAGIASCSNPVNISTEGDNQQVQGVVSDKAGNTSSIMATVKLDETAPTISTPAATSTLLVFGGSDTISAAVSDTLSGITEGEWFTGSDPGPGRGNPMTYSGGKITANVTVSSAAGTYTYSMRTKDTAGNWSSVVTVTVQVLL